MKTNRPCSELKIQNRYWKTNFASLIARTPNDQVKPRRTRIARARLVCVIPHVFLNAVTFLPELRSERKIKTNAIKLVKSMIKTGARKAT